MGTVHGLTSNVEAVSFATLYVVLLFILQVSLLNLSFAHCAANTGVTVWLFDVWFGMQLPQNIL